MIRGAGILFATYDGQALFLKRGAGGDFPGFWCLPGGKLEGDETSEECAVRETKEEVGTLPAGTRIELARSIISGPAAVPEITAEVAPGISVPAATLPGAAQPGEQVDFTTFLQKIETRFDPKISGEHVGFAWSPVTQPPEPLHPGVAITLKRLQADELGIARMIAAGELTSPQKYHNVWLFAIRITGTGAAYRSAVKHKKTDKILREEEFVWRKPDLYLNDEFLARCNGLPVIYEHPPKATLDSKEYRKRNIGSIFLPYIKGDEVWGIAKVFDEEAAVEMRDEDLSTSPTVVLGDPSDPGIKLRNDDGVLLNIEGKAVLLDHVAVCGLGVWDKGGDPAGVQSEAIGDSIDMTEEEKKAAADAKAKADAEEKAKADAAEKEKADARAKADAEMCSKMDSIADGFKKFDSFCADMGKRMDAFEAELKGKKSDSEAEMDKRKDGETEEAWKERMDKKRKDAEEAEAKKKADAEEEEKKKREDAAKADAAARSGMITRAELDAIAKRVDGIASTIKPRTPEERAKFYAAQAEADSVYVQLGKQAPPAMDGEELVDYRIRLAAPLQVHSTLWKDAKLATVAVADSVIFDRVTAGIYADAVAYAKRPGDDGSGRLRERSEMIDGHKHTTFHGRFRDWAGAFSGSGQRATGKIEAKTGGAR